MILRRITEHVKAQNWTAVALDFFIVVVGVFIGIQVSNWNEVRTERQREDYYLQRLDAEFDVVRERLSDGSATFEQSIRDIDMLLKTRRQHEQAPGTVDAADELLADAVGNITAGRVPAASPAAFREMVARGALESLSSDELRHALFAFDEFSGVAREGWRTLRDVHREAANAIWGLVDVSAYEELRRNGWPRNRKIVEAVEAYERQALQIAIPLRDPPAYRALVRGLIPLAAHSPYWTNCFSLSDGEEAYVEDCPEGVAPEISAAGIEVIANHPDIHRTLTEWAGFVGGFSTTLTDQNDAARRTIALIDAELERRQ